MALEKYRLKNGLISLSYKFVYRGRTYRGHLGPISLRQAKLAELQARVLAAEGRHPLPKRQQTAPTAPQRVPTFDQFTDRFLESFAVDARPSSVRIYANRLNVHLLRYFADRRLDEATPDLLDAYRTIRRQEGASARTVNNELTTLSAMLRKAVDLGIIPKSSRGPIPWLKVEEKPIRTLSPEDEAKLLLAATPRLRPLIRFALQTGLRRAELERLTWDDIDLKRREVTVVAHHAKNRHRRTVPLSRAALQVLHEVQVPRHGRVFGYVSIGQVMEDAIEHAGLTGVSCHSLRRTFATRCLEAGINVETVRIWLGHSKLTTTQLYVSPSAAYGRQAIELLGEPSDHRASLTR